MTDGTNDMNDGRGALNTRLPARGAPPGLHQRVRRSLGARRLIRETRTHRAWSIRLLAAAAVLCFAAGAVAGRSLAPSPAAATPRYALLLYGGQESDTGAAAASRAEEYGRWAAGLSGDATFVSGEELGRVVDELPAAVGREPVAGFFLVDADTDAIARRIARDCPHLKYGGRVVVQAIARR